MGFLIVHTRRVRPVGHGAHLFGMVQPYLWHGWSGANGESVENTGDHLAPGGGVWPHLPRPDQSHPMGGYGGVIPEPTGLLLALIGFFALMNGLYVWLITNGPLADEEE